MNHRLRVTKRYLTFPAELAVRVSGVDVLIDGHRVWSTMLAERRPERDGNTAAGPPAAAHPMQLAWPAPLRPHLHGVGVVSIADSTTGGELARAGVRLGSSQRRIEVKDAQGRWLALNKWNRLSATLAEDDPAIRERVVSRASSLIADLTAAGYTAYITSGTLLGAVRSGELLPHDDDADIGILLEVSHPSDISLASYRLEDELAALGHRVVRHSTAHLQVLYPDLQGNDDHYIDIFSAFYRAGEEFCQPFHIRTDLPRSSMVPLGEMVLEGRPFPTPATPADWLAACYGKGWRTPDPAFRFETPLSTRRRFDNWFGSQNLHRSYWDEYFESEADARSPSARLPPGTAQHSRAISRLLSAGAPVLEVGCGSGDLARLIARHGHPVIAVDYSYRGLALARRRCTSAAPAEQLAEAEQASGAERTHAHIDWRYLNLYDRRRVLELAASIVRTNDKWAISLNHVLEGLTAEGRANVFLMLRQTLGRTGFAVATADTNFVAAHYRFDDPQSWHLPDATLRKEAAAFGLSVQTVQTGSRRTRIGRRTTTTAILRRSRGSE